VTGGDQKTEIHVLIRVGSPYHEAPDREQGDVSPKKTTKKTRGLNLDPAHSGARGLYFLSGACLAIALRFCGVDPVK